MAVTGQVDALVGDLRIPAPQRSKWLLVRDFADSFRSRGFWAYGAWIETLLIYQSTLLGPVWIVVGTALFVVLLGILYGAVLNTGGPAYLLHIAIGYILWNFIQQVVPASVRLFRNRRAMILNGSVKLTDHLLKMYMTAGIYVLHNTVVVVGILLLTPATLSITTPAALLTLPLFCAGLMGGSILLSVIGARYHDLHEIVAALMRILFFVTPIVWMPHVHGKSDVIGLFLYLNPFYYLIEIVRAPLISGHVPWFEIGVVAAGSVLVWLVALFIYQRGRPYIVLWI